MAPPAETVVDSDQARSVGPSKASYSGGTEGSGGGLIGGFCKVETKLEEWPFPDLPAFSIDYAELHYPKVSIFHNAQQKPILKYSWPAVKAHQRARAAVVLLHDLGTHTVFEWLKHLPPISAEERREMEADQDATDLEKKEFIRLRETAHYEGSWVKKFNEAGLDVHAIDLQGHGLSKVLQGKKGQPKPDTFDEFAEDTCWLLEDVCRYSTIPIFLVGQGLGATIAARAVELLARHGKLGKPHVFVSGEDEQTGLTDSSTAASSSASTSSVAGDDVPGLKFATQPRYVRHTGRGTKEVPVEHVFVQARPIPVAGVALLSPLLTADELPTEEMKRQKQNTGDEETEEEGGFMAKIARYFGPSGDPQSPLASLLGVRMHRKNPSMPEYNVWYHKDRLTLKGLTPYGLYTDIRQGMDETLRDARWLLVPIERDSANTFSLEDWQESYKQWKDMMRAKRSTVLTALLRSKRNFDTEMPDLAPWLKDDDGEAEEVKDWRLEEQAAMEHDALESTQEQPHAHCRHVQRARMAFYLNILLVQSLEDTTSLPRGTVQFFKRIGGRVQASREVLIQLGELPPDTAACCSCGPSTQVVNLGSDEDSPIWPDAEGGDDDGWVDVVTDKPFVSAASVRSFQSLPLSKSGLMESMSAADGEPPASDLRSPAAESDIGVSETGADATSAWSQRSGRTKEKLDQGEDALLQDETDALQARVDALAAASRKLDEDLLLTKQQAGDSADGLARFGTRIRHAHLVRATTDVYGDLEQDADSDVVGVEEVKWVKAVPANRAAGLLCCTSPGMVKRVELVQAKVKIVDRILMMEATDSVKAVIEEIQERERLERERQRELNETKKGSWLLNCVSGGEPLEPVQNEPLYQQKRRWKRVQGVIIDQTGERVPVEEVERLRCQKPEDYARLFFSYGAVAGEENHARSALWLVPDMYHSLCQEDKNGLLATKLLERWILPVLEDLQIRERMWSKAAVNTEPRSTSLAMVVGEKTPADRGDAE
ncbi:lysophospholipase [Cystoisospora suis]|uniref:Lysophospholipase n=1 Tax=Cystoisospora suis TaxID=483139 RepID=A0A2C6KQ66_9APIC|nr:lysophospholipase [Cystoisospora suis]